MLPVRDYRTTKTGLTARKAAHSIGQSRRTVVALGLAADEAYAAGPTFSVWRALLFGDTAARANSTCRASGVTAFSTRRSSSHASASSSSVKQRARVPEPENRRILRVIRSCSGLAVSATFADAGIRRASAEATVNRRPGPRSIAVISHRTSVSPSVSRRSADCERARKASSVVTRPDSATCRR